jgi:hypothetical protein
MEIAMADMRRLLPLLGGSTLSACAVVVGIEEHHLVPGAPVDGGLGGTEGGGTDASALSPDGGDPCRGGNSICENFDGAELATWQPPAGVTLATDSVSPPHSLSVQASVEAYISRPIKIPSMASCELDAKVDDWSGEAWFFVIQNASWRNPDVWEVGWSKKDGRTMLAQYSLEAATTNEVESYPVADPPPSNTWVHVRLDVTLGGDAVLVVNGLPPLKTPVPVPKTNDFVVLMGLSHSVTSETTVLFDNVVCVAH